MTGFLNYSNLSSTQFKGTKLELDPLLWGKVALKMGIRQPRLHRPRLFGRCLPDGPRDMHATMDDMNPE